MSPGLGKPNTSVETVVTGHPNTLSSTVPFFVHKYSADSGVYSKPLNEAPIDISRSSQIRDIESSFVAATDNFDLSSIKHPNKPNVTAIESYEVLPDANIWANAYDLFRFSERPGDKPRPPDVRCQH